MASGRPVPSGVSTGIVGATRPPDAYACTMGAGMPGHRTAVAGLLGAAVAALLLAGLLARSQPRAALPAARPTGDGGCQPATPYVIATAGPGSPGIGRAGSGCTAGSGRTAGLPLRQYPDAPIDGPLPVPGSVRSLVEHRSALHGTRLVLRGVVVEVRPALLARSPTSIGRLPQLTLADTTDPDRDRAYDVRSTLPQSEDGKDRIGDIVERHWRVYGNREHVTLEFVE